MINLKKPNRNKTNRKAFARSNTKAVQWLLARRYDPVILITHCRHKDMMYTAFRGIIKETDLFNLWDGVAVKKGNIVWLQIKTNSWPSEKKITAWLKNKKNVKGVALNVRENGKVSIREYESL